MSKDNTIIMDENVPTFEEAYSVNEQINYYIRNNTYPSFLQAASIKAYEAGDTELADAFKKIVCMMDFSEDEGFDDETIVNARKELREIIHERNSRKCYNSYRWLMTDDQVIAAASGQITVEDDIDDNTGMFIKGGMYDPEIFGGTGVMPVSEKGADSNAISKMFSTYGEAFGYYRLPVKVIQPDSEYDLSHLLGIDSDDIYKITHYGAFVVTESTNDKYPVGTVLSPKDDPNGIEGATCMIGAAAIEKLLVDLTIPDHPEKLVFQILPVMPTRIRPMIFNRECGKYASINDINHLYLKVMRRARRLKRLIELGCPEIILHNESRILQENIDILFDGGEFETEDGDEVKYGGIKRLVHKFHNKNRYVALTAVLGQRKLFSGYKKPENLKWQAIKSPGIFPEVVTLVKDGETETLPYSQIMNDNYCHAGDVAPSCGDEYESKEAWQADKDFSDKLYDLTDEIRTVALSGKPVKVKFDDELEIYVLTD